MNSDNQPITGVPTNIITGFLGVGKTSAILSLMKDKPENERWAILVNEFGEIGIDGSLVQGQHKDKQQVFIREVPGGCMCCAAGLPMQIALNQLLSEARPDRLLIEPTGLGHPKEVLEVLSTEHYRQVLSLQKTVTLVDARRLSDSRYTQHDTFNQQISIADTIVGNKFDLYQQGDSEKLTTYVAKVGRPNTKVVFAEHGAIPLSEFEGETSIHQHPPHHHHHHSQSKPLVSEQDLPESGFLKAENEGEGFQSVGWRFSPDKVFNRQKLILLLVELDVERMKAVFITEDGIFGYNLTSDGLTEVVLDDYFESRIELISDTIDDTFEEQLLSCLQE
ncbi:MULTISPECIES: CobW family GTP-binding protein [Vibrio]|uniref:GTP-binding protein n=1 Tax=Vibrio mediterranei TaxID=689 RepID=A0A3G4VID0_9VIBR|nr:MULTISPECIES: GTP-binding protein [Vibrio]AYV24115.1 GTP-binding protein [Vibrio mediterranei]EDL55837.1 putative GTPase [Vibrio mediterranei AK1]MCF4173833.1 GTP-binding protein [Vibrio sp. McD22-P3]MCG9789290.1 GTP-binding protein [Vibrio mediterranei]MCY9852402.1 GTP-binding protein [Vibrio mediterranei]